MENKKEKLIIDGNAFYEIDMECMKQKEKERKESENRRHPKRQRN